MPREGEFNLGEGMTSSSKLENSSHNQWENFVPVTQKLIHVRVGGTRPTGRPSGSDFLHANVRVDVRVCWCVCVCGILLGLEAPVEIARGSRYDSSSQNPDLTDKFSPHVLDRTFCTKCHCAPNAENEHVIKPVRFGGTELGRGGH